MSNEKKYIIVRHNRDGSINSYFGGNQNDYPPYNKMIPSVWYSIIDKASTFTRSEAEKMYAIMTEYYNAIFNADIKIHEYIPAHCGEAVKSDKDRVIEKLKYAIECNNYVIEDMEQADTVFRGVYKVADYLAEAIRILKDMK